MLVHGEQAIELHRPIPVEGDVSTVGEITGIYDKGKGAVVEITVGVDRRRHRPAAVHQRDVGVHPRRGRLRRRPRPVGARNVAPDRAPDHAVTYADPPRPGA